MGQDDTLKRNDQETSRYATIKLWRSDSIDSQLAVGNGMINCLDKITTPVCIMTKGTTVDYC